jgi:hypothetical protein
MSGSLSDQNLAGERAAPSNNARHAKLMEDGEPTAKRKRPRGRPKRADAPVVPWDEVDRLLIFGETIKDPKTGQEAVRFPSLADLAKRYGISRNLVWRYSNRAKCFQRREEARLKTQARFEQKVIEQTANSRAAASSDVGEIVNVFVSAFRRALDEGRVRTDSPSDLDRLIRLRALIDGGPDSRSELTGTVTLEALQARHRRLRDQVDGMAPELSGTTSQGAGEDDVQRDLGGKERGDGGDH